MVCRALADQLEGNMEEYKKYRDMVVTYIVVSFLSLVKLDEVIYVATSSVVPADAIMASIRYSHKIWGRCSIIIEFHQNH